MEDKSNPTLDPNSPNSSKRQFLGGGGECRSKSKKQLKRTITDINTKWKKHDVYFAMNFFSKSKPGEELIKCSNCTKWAHAWCGCEVYRIILLRDLKGAMRLDRSKDMSVHVSTCTSYDSNTLTPVVVLIRRVCFYVSSEKRVIGF
jgi:hypothetical protein